MTAPDTALDAIRALPKVELHIHVEACLTEERIAELAAEAGTPMLRPAGQLFQYSTLRDFLETYEWWCDLLRSVDVAEQLAYDTAAYMHGEGIVYAEVFVGPRYWTHLRYDELIKALERGFESADRDGLADCRLLPSISREQPVEWGMELVEWMAEHAPRVVGLGLDGNEAVLGRTSPRWKAVFARAGDLGLGRSAHAGESSGPEGVRDALDYLHVDRVDHGVRASEDANLVRRLAEEGVTLTVCPGSNVFLNMYPSVAEHPVRELADAGVPVTINSDDPIVMNLSLNREFVEMLRVGWDMDDIVRSLHRAIEAAFCDESRKRYLRAALDSAAPRPAGDSGSPLPA